MLDELIHKLRISKIKIDIVEEKLDVKAPKGAMTKSLIEDIKKHKEALIDYVKSSQSNTVNYSEIQKVAKQEGYLVSPTQKRLWILSQFKEQSIAYNMPQHRVLSEGIHIGNFEKAILSTIERHEILRTVFNEDANGELRQYIRTIDELNFTVDHQDFSKEENDKQKAIDYINKDVVKPFDLANGPLLRVAVLKLANQENIFYYNMHHIISDGWSMNVLTNDVMHFYEALQLQIESTLTPLRIHYKDYANWQLERLENPALTESKNFWKNEFTGELPILDLPTQKKRPLAFTNNGRSLQTYFSKELTRKLNTFCTQKGGSLFMGLLSSLNALFSRYTDQNEFIIGTPIAGRDHVDLENQIGAYVNMLALKNEVNVADTYETLFQKVKTKTLQAYKHQTYPFDRIIEDISLKRDMSRNPIFDAIMILQNIGDSVENEYVDAVETIIDKGEDVSKYDVCFTFKEVGGHISFNITFNTDVYETDMMKQFIQHYKNMLSELLVQPSTNIINLNYITAEEKTKLLYTFNDTAEDFSQAKTIAELVEEQAEKTPNATALMYVDATMSYKELNDVANQFARYLMTEQQVAFEDMVGVQLDRSEMYVAVLLGILKTGSCCAPVDLKISEEKLNYIKENTKVVVTNSIFKDFLQKKENYSSDNLDIDYDLESLAYIVFTSGSTGVPKGCMLQQKGIVNQLASKIEVLDLDEDTSLCHTSKMYFVGAIWSLWAPLTIGGKVIITTLEELRDIPKLIDKVNAYDVKVLEVIPSQLIALFSINSERKLKGIEKLVLSGEKLTTSYVNRFFKINPQIEIINAYGQTECSDITTNYIINSELEEDKVLVGKPIRNISMYILDEEDQLCPVGVVGEICSSGIGVSKGYLNQEELTSQKFIENRFKPEEGVIHKSGDLGKWLPDGNIEILGRRDHQVAIRGHRVELDEIESSLQKNESVQDVVVLAKELTPGEVFLVAYLTAKQGKELKVSNLRMYLKERLQEYMIPSYFVVLDELPLTPNGKIDKKILPNPKEMTLETGNAFVEAQTDAEKMLVAIIKEILQVEKVSVKDGFYDLGGDSIKLIKLTHELKKAGYNTRPEQILQALDIQDIAKNLSNQKVTVEVLETEKFCPIKALASMDEKLVALSENQKYMMRHSESQAIIGTFVLSMHSEAILEEELKIFLSHFPELHIEFVEKNGIVYQKKSTIDKQKVRTIQTTRIVTNDTLIDWEHEMLETPFDIVNEEAIRLHILKDSVSERTWFSLAISHVLVDLHSAIELQKALSEFMVTHTVPNKEELLNSLHYSIWQQQYLNSEKGKQSRDFWNTYLQQSAFSKETQVKDANTTQTYKSYVAVITGNEYKAIQAFANKAKVSISVVFMTYHQYILEKLFGKEVSLQLMLVNGRENIVEEVDTSKILGVINNALPLSIMAQPSVSFKEQCYNLQNKYIEARQHQSIPFETIKSDFIKQTDIDIALLKKGAVNFQQLEGEFDIGVKYDAIEKEIIIGRNIYVDMTCKQRENGIQIEFISSPKTLKKLKKVALMPSNILKFLP